MLIKSIHFPNDAQRRAIAGQTKMLEAKRTGINLISMVWKLELHMLGVQKCLKQTLEQQQQQQQEQQQQHVPPKCCRLILPVGGEKLREHTFEILTSKN